MDEPMQSIDRRLFLGAGASTLMGLPALAQQGAGGEAAKPGEPKPSQAGRRCRRASAWARSIADYVVGFELKDAPAVAVDRARVAFTDTVGVMLAGSRQEVSHILCDMVRLEGSTPSASIVGQSLRASPQLAALANGVAAHAMDYDLTYVAGQAASAVIPAVLPVAEITGATPAEAMAATIIGFEVASRVGRSNFLASSVGGWHTVGTIGVIAAAAACARLLKVPVEQIPDIIGISASMASGLSVNFGSMTKPLHSGHAARDGVMAALLGARGFTSNPSALEGHSGYFEDFGRGLEVSADPFKDLGQPLRPRRHGLRSQGLSVRRAGAYRDRGGAGVARAAGAAPLRHHQHPLLGHPQRRPARRHPVSAVGGERQVQPGLHGGLFAGARRPDDRGLHRGGDQGRDR